MKSCLLQLISPYLTLIFLCSAKLINSKSFYIGSKSWFLSIHIHYPWLWSVLQLQHNVSQNHRTILFHQLSHQSATSLKFFVHWHHLPAFIKLFLSILPWNEHPDIGRKLIEIWAFLKRTFVRLCILWYNLDIPLQLAFDGIWNFKHSKEMIIWTELIFILYLQFYFTIWKKRIHHK